MSLRTAVAALLIFAAIACAGDPTRPEFSPRGPSLNVAGAADDAPNVWRYQAEFAFGIQDPETDLTAFAGLPHNPRESVQCGGAEPFAIADFHDAGVQQGVIHRLVEASSVNLHVYRRSTFRGFCVSTPIAQGTGRMMVNDNDVFVTGSGANAWGFRMEGRVALVSGGDAALMAHNRFLILPDGSFRRIFRMVRLSGL